MAREKPLELYRNIGVIAHIDAGGDEVVVVGPGSNPRTLEMLKLARAKLQHLPAGKIELVQGDFTDLPFAEARFDTVILHQVLHFAQHPEIALQVARVIGMSMFRTSNGASSTAIWLIASYGTGMRSVG